jgi:3-hydroxyacyl-CoA dehydrogenase/enoyl-CoA hydratase/3-hydroxybutyryl-CoA epimerase
MPVGPLQLVDETSLELGLSIARATRAGEGEPFPSDPSEDLLLKMVETHDRKGRKNGRGVYDYDEKGKRRGFWPGLAELFPRLATQPSVEETQHRLILIQALEAVRALEEGVLTDIREGDVGAVLGWGFAPWSGGPFSWIDMTGAARVVEIATDLAARHGDRFAPPESLAGMAAEGRRFYAPAAAAA